MIHRTDRGTLTTFLLAMACVLVAPGGRAAERPLPPGLSGMAAPSADAVEVPPPDLAPIVAEDALRDRLGIGPFRFAVPLEADLAPDTAGSWRALPDGRWWWRLEIRSEGATSLNLAMRDVRLPKGTGLWLHDPAGTVVRGPFGPADLTPDGELWTPIVPGDVAVLEAAVPAGVRDRFALTVFRINYGYRSAAGGMEKSGTCNVDVACPEGDPWRDQIRSVAWYTLQGWATCSGYLVADAPHDGTPYFLTADHCGVRAYNAATMVFYWNDQSPTCGQHGGGTATDTQSGAIFRSTWERSDTTLVELEERPPAEYGVYSTGYDATGATPSTGIVGIHHPNLDEKSISYDTDTVATVDETYWRVQWDVGTTEGGSSGSLVMDRASGLAVGVLTGGYASCQNRDGYDYYSKLAVAWEGGGTPETSVRPWLDPNDTGALVVPGMEPDGTPGGLRYWVPVVISDAGYAGSYWKTDVTLIRRGGGLGGATATLIVHLPDGDHTIRREIRAGEQVTVEDVVAAAGGSGKGTLEIRIDTPLGVTARVYDDTGHGTFGQFEQGVLHGGGLLGGETAVLAGLRQEEGRFRTNLQVANIGSQDASVRVHLYDTTGLELADYDLDIPAGGVVQDIQPFDRRANRPGLGWGYATVQVVSGMEILPTASVIDSRTNDAVTVEPTVATPEYRATDDADESRWLPVVARLDGSAGSRWRSSIAVINRGTLTSAATLAIRLDDGTSWTRPLEIAPGEQAAWDDILGAVGASGKGTLEIQLARGLAAVARLYNESADGTFGQWFGGITASEGAAEGATLLLPGLRQQSGLWRTNLTLANAGQNTITAQVTLHAADGDTVTAYTIEIDPGAVVQDLQPFDRRANRPNIGWGYATIHVTGGSGLLLSASVIDSRTNDATTVTPLP